MSEVRLGIVGCGRIARAYAEAAAGCEDLRITAVADAHREAAEELARRTGARPVDGHAAMTGIDAVLVSTPPDTHVSIATHFAERGVPVLCEKPFALDLESALALARAGRRGGVCVAMASKFRYVEDVAEARRLVHSGAIGDLVLCENAFTSQVDMAGRWNSDARISGGGVLIDNGSHAFDLLRWFAGPLAQVAVAEAPRVQGLEVEETVQVTARSRRGVACRVDLSWSIDRGSDVYLRLSGSAGTVSVGWRRSSLRRRGAEPLEYGSGYDKTAALRQQLRQFARAVRGHDADLVTPIEALASVAAVQAGYEALRKGRWAAIRDFDEAAIAAEARTGDSA